MMLSTLLYSTDSQDDSLLVYRQRQQSALANQQLVQLLMQSDHTCETAFKQIGGLGAKVRHQVLLCCLRQGGPGLVLLQSSQLIIEDLPTPDVGYHDLQKRPTFDHSRSPHT